MVNVLFTKTKQRKMKHKGTQGNLGGDGYVSYLDCGDGLTGICICPNSSNGIH